MRNIARDAPSKVQAPEYALVELFAIRFYQECIGAKTDHSAIKDGEQQNQSPHEKSNFVLLFMKACI